jgi:hypothetical protein
VLFIVSIAWQQCRHGRREREGGKVQTGSAGCCWLLHNSFHCWSPNRHGGIDSICIEQKQTIEPTRSPVIKKPAE